MALDQVAGTRRRLRDFLECLDLPFLSVEASSLPTVVADRWREISSEEAATEGTETVSTGGFGGAGGERWKKSEM